MGASLRMLERDLKVAQKTDCMSRPFGHIRMDGNQTPPTTRPIDMAEEAEPHPKKAMADARNLSKQDASAE
jgi:hypothetical protein